MQLRDKCIHLHIANHVTAAWVHTNRVVLYVIVADNENKRNTFKLGATYALAQLFIGFSGVYSESFGSHSLHK